MRFIHCVSCLGVLWVLGCSGSGLTLRHAGQQMGESEKASLADAVERYFAATEAKEMRDAVEAAGRIGPDSGAYHFIAADLARFDESRDERFAHLVQGALDIDSEYSFTCLRNLFHLSFTYQEREMVRALLTEIAKNHNDPAVRDYANFGLTYHLRADGEFGDAEETAAAYGWKMPLTVIGTWDNEQGKGFDMVFPPEEGIDLEGSYLGHYVEVGWRDDVAMDAAGIVDFSEMLFPTMWAVAYAVSAFEAAEAGAYELRVQTSDGLKVWVNDALVFVERKVDGDSFDTVTIPIALNKGVNRVLIKSAQDDNSNWSLAARLTREGGATTSASAFRPVKADATLAALGQDLAEPLSGGQLVEREITGFKDNTATKHYMRIIAADRAGLDIYSIEAAESYLKQFPGSFRAQYEHAMSLWGMQEKAKANLALTSLFENHSDEFVLIGLQQARFWRQNRLERKAYDLLKSMAKASPHSTGAKFALASWYLDEGWIEDYCFVVEDINREKSDWPTAKYDLIDCYERLGFEDKAKDGYREILEHIPYSYTSLNALYEYAIGENDFDTAGKYLQKMRTAWPDLLTVLGKWAEYNRRQRNYPEFKAAVLKIQATRPDSPWSYERLAHLAYYLGQTEEAIALWKTSLEKYPDDGDLQERVSYLRPEKKEQWQLDAPTPEDIHTAIAMRDKIQVPPGTNLIYLMDDEVERLKVDGSTVSVITAVKHALNIEGKDAITTFKVGCFGRTKVLTAFAVSPAGEVVEASTISGNQVGFKGVEVGSTIAVQARCEESSNSYLGSYFSKRWSFQGVRTHFLDSRYVLWMPEETKMEAFTRGEIKQEESMQDGLKRVSWRAQNTPVLIPETAMPPSGDVAWRLSLSSVPGWEMFYEWEQALLVDAFRASPEVKALAKKLKGDITDKEKLVNAIQAYLSTEIRYKQEYENPIAGVKPHPAPMVISRGYGDCKDKVVLFMTLAKLMGIEARFTLVRTRDRGQIVQETPSQQFNHAIVFIPKQDGIEAERFYDPTADGLDVATLYSGDAGTWAMVLDLEKRSFEWKEIPYQTPETAFDNRTLSAAIDENGVVSGMLTVDSQGLVAAKMRRISRNEERLSRALQVIADGVLPGATVVEAQPLDIDDVERPVTFSYQVSSDSFVRKNDKKISFRIPSGINISKYFVIDERKYPLVLGAPFSNTWDMEFTLPTMVKKVEVPDDYTLDTECIAFSRTIKQNKKRVAIKQNLQFKCPHIPAEQYDAYKQKIQQFRQQLEAEVTITGK